MPSTGPKATSTDATTTAPPSDAVRRELERAEELLRAACDFEGLISQASERNRDESKAAVGVHRTDARWQLLAALSEVMRARSAVPGATDAARSDRLTLIATFAQGTRVTETLIMEGQYAKAAAVLKQDYEIVARLAEIRAGAAKKGVTPQVKHATAGSQWMYGDLNKVAHPSNEHMLSDLLSRLEKGEVRGVSPVPAVTPETARGLYDCHLFTLIEVVREASLLHLEMYPGDEALLEKAAAAFGYAVKSLKGAGFLITKKP